jgi:hypothetical protein
MTAEVKCCCPECGAEFSAKPEGGHRLLCGDSTDALVAEKVLKGIKPQMVFADPPYGMRLDADYSSEKSTLKMLRGKGLKGGRRYSNVIGDHADFDRGLIDSIFANFGAAPEMFLWGADYYSDLIPARNDGSWVVWDKRLDETADRMYGSCFELCWSRRRHKREMVRVKWAGVFGVEKEPDRRRWHPTQKPVELVRWFIDRWCAPNSALADPYVGSGTTILAAEMTGLICCLGVEISPAYVDVSVKRWSKFTGRAAVLADDGRTFEQVADARGKK